MPARRRLFIIGASNFGRELESWLELIPPEGRDWEIAGYLHSFQGESPLMDYPSDYDIVGEWESYPYRDTDLCIISVADVDWKKRIFQELSDKVSFYTYIAPTATIGKFVTIGLGSIICPHCILTTNICIGACVTLNIGTRIGHDVSIGDYSSIMSNVVVSGKCTISEQVYIGSSAVLIPERKIGQHATVGAGSVVIVDVKGKTTVFGNPAMIVKY
ncbi:MAG: acetyltransferase [bacterium]